METNGFTSLFGNNKVPEILLSLLEFDNQVATDGWFSEGFEFMADEEKLMLSTYSEEPDFLNAFFPFAQADASGSVYAFWNPNSDIDLEETPIAVFGSEGGYHVIAANIHDLLRILTYDAEPMIDWDDISFYKDEEEHEPGTHSAEYKRWLNDRYQLSPTDNPDELVEKAQEKYQGAFNEWMERYLE